MIANPDFIRWENHGVSINANYMTIVCDKFSFDYYPVYSGSEEESKKVESDFSIKPMQQVIKSYKISKENDQAN
jgi:hypothetical protein